MGKKLSIALASDVESPRVDAVRKRLGGRVNTESDSRSSAMPAAGTVVSLRRETASPLYGVVVFVEGDLLHVMTDGSTVRRTTIANVDAAAAGDLEVAPFASLAADARVFSGLEEGQRVRYVDEVQSLREGLLVEKCRYGGIVLRDDRTLVGVGFRKLWPVANAAEEPS